MMLQGASASSVRWAWILLGEIIREGRGRSRGELFEARSVIGKQSQSRNLELNPMMQKIATGTRNKERESEMVAEKVIP